MHERIVEILLFLVNELKSKKQLSEVDVSLLTKNGYTQSEISTAFSWLFERMSLGQQLFQTQLQNPASHRLLHEAEKMVITSEGYGYLLQCKQLGLVTNADVETIIDRIMSAGFSSVGIAEMRSFIAGILFGGDESSSGGRISLDGDETIH